MFISRWGIGIGEYQLCMTHEYPPKSWTCEALSQNLSHPHEFEHLPSYSEEEVWDRIQNSSKTAELAGNVIQRADKIVDERIPRLTASLYLDFHRTGRRDRYQDKEFDRIRNLGVLTAAECMERDSQYLDKIHDYIWTICEQTTWLLPAHTHIGHDEFAEEGLIRNVGPDKRFLGLHTTRFAHILAEIRYVLGEQLHPVVRERIENEIDERVLIPYETETIYSWEIGPEANNWNAVCNASILCAAIHVLEDDKRLAEILKKGIDSLHYFLNYFDSDGWTTEGLHYWNYGFRHYVHLAHLLDKMTDGTFDLLAVPIVEKIAKSPLETELSPGTHLPFSDTILTETIQPYVGCYLGSYFGTPELSYKGLTAMDSVEFGRPLRLFRNLSWCYHFGEKRASYSLPLRTYFQDSEVFITRNQPSSDCLVLAAKGGDNGGIHNHNHNDCGAFVIHHAGETLIQDVGSPKYDADYQDPEKRYEIFAARSLGHSVPLVNGMEQGAGEEFDAKITQTNFADDHDVFRVDLSDCYPPDADIDSLSRRFSYTRGDQPRVEVEDQVQFENDNKNRFESILISFCEPMMDGEKIIYRNKDALIALSFGTESHFARKEYVEDALNLAEHTDSNNRLMGAWRTRIGTGGHYIDSTTYSVKLVFEPSL